MSLQSIVKKTTIIKDLNKVYLDLKLFTSNFEKQYKVSKKYWLKLK